MKAAVSGVVDEHFRRISPLGAVKRVDLAERKEDGDGAGKNSVGEQ
ncbi:hypothetical protein [Desulfitobacterium hafniense]|nr:hypothetical protein [Desulfitobacterium hafniense]